MSSLENFVTPPARGGRHSTWAMATSSRTMTRAAARGAKEPGGVVQRSGARTSELQNRAAESVAFMGLGQWTPKRKKP